ncbi:IS110 family transposase, partial [Ferrimicrobium acidiphilum]
AGKAKVMRFARSKSTRDPSRLIDEIFEALSQQSVSVSGTAAVELVIPTLALNIKTLKAQRVEVAEQVEKLLANYPLLEVLMSIP